MFNEVQGSKVVVERARRHEKYSLLLDKHAVSLRAMRETIPMGSTDEQMRDRRCTSTVD